MNILYINHYAGSLSMGMEFRPFYFAREWKKMGHNVRIVTADFSHLRQKNPIVKKDFEKQYIDGIEYQFIKTDKYNGNGIKRALTMFKFVHKLKSKAKYFATEFKPDAIITSSTYPLDGYAGDKIKNKCKKIGKKCKWIHEEHDIWPLTLIELKGMSKYNPFIVLLQKAADFSYTHADKLVSLFPNAIENMKEHGLADDSKFFHISNGVVHDDWKNSEPLSFDIKYFLDITHSENKFIIGYLGGHAISNNLDYILDAAKILLNKKICFVFVGDGVEKNRLICRAKNEGISNVFFFNSIKKTQIYEYLSSCNALILASHSNMLCKFGCSINKIYDYMMSGRPIIWASEGFANNDIEEAKCGICVSPNNINELVNAIENMSTLSDDEMYIMGQNGKNWVLNNAEYKVLSKKFIEIMK